MHITSYYHRFDCSDGSYYEWHGGSGVNLYSAKGIEADYFSLGGPDKPSLGEVITAIENHISTREAKK